MKFLKYLFFFVLGVTLIFFLIGLVNSSIEYGHEITVSKSAEEAWAVSKDESKFNQWLEGFKSIELLSGELGEVGSTYKVVVNPGEGQPDFEMTETIISIKEYDHIEMHYDNEMMDFEQTISFSESEEGVKIKTDSKVFGKGLMLRSMFALMEMSSGSFQTQEAKNIDALKKVIEENTTDYYPVEIEPELEVVETEEVSE